jgi:hypothetical protein
VKPRLLLNASLLAALVAGAPTWAGENNEEKTANVAMDDTPSRRTPPPPPAWDSNRDPGPGPGGAIFNPLSQAATAPGPAEAAVAAPGASEESSLGTTIAVAIGGLAVFSYLVRRLLNSG